MELHDLGKLPISESNPTGEDIRLDPDFEALSNEIEKMSSASFSGTMDWGKVVALSSAILSGKSKDLLVACYLCVGLLSTEGLIGLAKGVHIFRDLLETHWEALFPSRKRMKGRKNAFEWWAERVRATLPSLKNQTWPESQKDPFIEDLKAVDEFLGENLEDAPVLTPLIRNVSALIDTKRSETDAEKAVSTESEKAGPAERKPPATQVSETGTARPADSFAEMDKEQLFKQGLGILGRLASIIAREDPFNPLYFRLNRVVSWISVQSMPPNTDGKTLISPPEEQIVASLTTLYRAGEWKALIEAAESRVPEYIFWIDLSRYTSESLTKLGHPDISEAVADETRKYAKRIAGIERLAFSDGTPFANEATREWLKHVSPQENVALADKASNGMRESIEKETSQAMSLIRENRLSDAMNIFREKLNRASSAREHFIWKIAFCRLLNQTDQTQLSPPYLRSLLEYIDCYKLEQWDPLLAVEALTVVLSGMRRRGGENGEIQAMAVFERISALDPARAFDLL